MCELQSMLRRTIRNAASNNLDALAELGARRTELMRIRAHSVQDETRLETCARDLVRDSEARTAVRYWHIPAGSERARRDGKDPLNPCRANGSFPHSLSRKPSFRLRPIVLKNSGWEPPRASFESARPRP